MTAALLITVLAAAAAGEVRFYPPPPPVLEGYRVVSAHGGDPGERLVAVPPPALPARQAAPPPAAPSPAIENLSAGEPVADARARVALDDERHPFFGVQVHAGLPDGFGASLVLRPWRALRLHGGGLTNTLSSGLTGGVTLSPFDTIIAPTLTAEAGFLSEADLTPTLRWASKEPLPDGELASGSYRFYSAHLGLEIGAPRRFVFFVRAGLSRVDATLTIQPREVGTGETAARLEPGEMAVHLTMPSARAGFTLYL